MTRPGTLLLAGVLCLSGPATAADARFAAVDDSYSAIADGVTRAGLRVVLEMDHARLAEKAGVVMPPARVLLFSDSAVNGRLLRDDPRVGLDLPFKVLAYAAGAGPGVVYTGDAFVAQRHGLAEGDGLAAYRASLARALEGAGETPEPAPRGAAGRNLGIIELMSAYPFDVTIERLKAAVTAQDDTLWFGELDFRAEAAVAGIELEPATLLLFGGPAPGGMAMRDFPRLGLDAFCQKLFVYRDDDGAVRVLFNSIKTLAELHYGRSADVHQALDRRLTATFKQAIDAR